MMLEEKKVLIIGGGGHSRVVIDSFRKLGYLIDGIVDPAYKIDKLVSGVPVVGGDEVFDRVSVESIEIINGVGVLPGRIGRWKIADRMRNSGFKFVTVVDPDAVISSNVTVSEGVQIMAGCVLQDGVKVGSDSVVNTGTILDHDCDIGEKCWISPGVTVCGGSRIGSNAYIGAGATLLENISIGDGALISAGATVFEEIAPGEIYK